MIDAEDLGTLRGTASCAGREKQRADFERVCEGLRGQHRHVAVRMTASRCPALRIPHRASQRRWPCNGYLGRHLGHHRTRRADDQCGQRAAPDAGRRHRGLGFLRRSHQFVLFGRLVMDTSWRCHAAITHDTSCLTLPRRGAGRRDDRVSHDPAATLLMLDTRILLRLGDSSRIVNLIRGSTTRAGREDRRTCSPHRSHAREAQPIGSPFACWDP